MSTAPFRKFGRRVARLPLILGLALGTTALAASAAQATPGPVPWNANYHDFGSTSSSYGFVFTDLYTWPVKGLPPVHPGGPYLITADTCKRAVAPGRSCLVKVGYTPDGQSAADSLQMHFTTLGGRPVAVPAVQLFAGGAPYVYTSHQNGAFTFPAAATADSRTARMRMHALGLGDDVTIPFWYHGPPGPGPVEHQLEISDPWATVLSSTCTTPIEGSAGCMVTIQAAQNTGALRTAILRVQFENSQTGAPVPAQGVTLVQSAG